MKSRVLLLVGVSEAAGLRVVAMNPTDAHSSVSRRTWLKHSAMVTSALAAGIPSARAQQAGQALRMPPAWSGGDLVIAPANLQIWPGFGTAALTINGSLPGPTIRLRKGQRFQARIHNQLPNQKLVLHWHGLLAPAGSDGHPRQEVPPGGSYEVDFPVIQDPATCWYHAHTHDLTAEHVYKGLAGLFIIDDPERDAALGLPTGSHDVPMIIRDWKSNASAQFNYAPSMFEHMWGFVGDRVLVNGTPDAFMPVDQGLWRLRLLNACNARVLRIGFADARPLRVFAGDGGLTGAIESVAFFDLAPGQRAELLVSFADLAPGSTAILRSLAFPTLPAGGGPAGPRQGDPLDIMTFRVETPATARPIPAQLPGPAMPDPVQSARTRTFQLGVVNQQHTINLQTYALDRIDFEVPAGEVEIWQFINNTGNFHPMHVHGAYFRVFERRLNNNAQPLIPTDGGLRDTVLVRPNETVRIAIRFGSRAGEFLMHCHNLEHEHEMMTNFLVGPLVPPPLTVTRSDAGVVCHWPSAATGWILQTSDDLASWQDAPGDPILTDGRFEWSEPDRPGQSRRFFRLILP
jgi:FtsP/CotA-like multicopper oxidase with cupredoxin domain